MPGASVRTNEAQVFADMDAFADMLVRVVAPRAANKLRDQARTAGLRKVAEVYRVGVRQIDAYVTVRNATQGNPSAELVVAGSGFPMELFNPRQVKGKGGGVRVQIKGQTILIPHAFIARMRSGKVAVLARGSYKGGRIQATGERFKSFSFGRQRLPVNRLFTFGPAQTFRNPDVTDAMNARLDEQAAKVIAQEVRFARGGGA